MLNVLTRKLEAFGRLPPADRQLLDDLIRERRVVNSRVDLIREGDPTKNVYLILEGFACRYKILPNGKRHIVAYLVPGDFCDLHVFILKRMDHSLGTLSRCTVAEIPRDRVLEIAARPAIGRALWWATLVDEATLREWLINIGGRSAERRVGHLLCELFMRLEAVGLTNGNSYELPLTQEELGDTMGITTVHVNRVIQRLRGKGLITLKGSKLAICDIKGLRDLSGFNPNYLHLDEQNGHKEPTV